MSRAKYKKGDVVLLPRKSNFNARYDRDVWATIADIRQGRVVSYLCIN